MNTTWGPFWPSLVQIYPHMNTLKHPLSPQRFVVFATSALHYESVYPFFLTLKSVRADYTTQDKRLIKDGCPVLSCRVGGDNSLQRDRRERERAGRECEAFVSADGADVSDRKQTNKGHVGLTVDINKLLTSGTGIYFSLIPVISADLIITGLSVNMIWGCQFHQVPY